MVRRLAHELRRPLSRIDQLVFYLEMVTAASDGKARRRIAELQSELRHARSVIADALFFYKPSPARLVPLDLNEVVAQTVKQWEIGDRGWICLQLEHALPPVMLDLEQAEHVVRHLVLHFAAKASRRRAVIVKAYAAAEGVVLEISASADATVPDCLLEPAAGTKCNCPYGLASVKRILDAHGATIGAVKDGPGRVAIRVVFQAA